MPKRPPISIEWFYPSYYSTASVEERISAMTEFKALHATYMQDMKEYLNAHGTKNIPQNRIRDCLAEQRRQAHFAVALGTICKRETSAPND